MRRMSKIVIQIALIISLFLGFVTTNVSYADGIDPSTFEVGTTSQIDESFTTEYGGKILSFFTGLSMVVAVISLAIIGIKYITTGSLTFKAEYKKDLMPVLIGIFFISLLTTILSLIVRLANSL